MSRRAARLEQLLIELADQLGASTAVRLIYDDYHAGDRLALVSQGPAGLCELQVWRELDSKQQPRVHLLCDGSAAADQLRSRVEAWSEQLPWRARGKRQFAERVAGMARQLSASFEARAQGYPTQARTALEAALGPARPLAGVTGPLKGNQAEPLAVVAGGQAATLWAAAVHSPELPPEVGVRERALIWDPQARAFIAPRELRATLSRSAPLAEVAQHWPTWCLAPPPPQIVEQQIADLDFRSQAAERGDQSSCGDDCFDCLIFSDLLCMPIDCLLLDLEFGALECGAFECGALDCGLLECGALDCGALDILSCG